MIDLSNNPAAAPGRLHTHLSRSGAWVVVLGDHALAASFDGFATGPIRAVILAPNTAAVRAELNSRGGMAVPSHARAVAVGATSGDVVDVVQAGETVDNARIFEAFINAETS